MVKHEMIEPDPDTIQQYEYDSGPQFPTKVFALVVGNKLFGRKAYVTREEAEQDGEDISEFLGGALRGPRAGDPLEHGGSVLSLSRRINDDGGRR